MILNEAIYISYMIICFSDSSIFAIKSNSFAILFFEKKV